MNGSGTSECKTFLFFHSQQLKLFFLEYKFSSLTFALAVFNFYLFIYIFLLIFLYYFSLLLSQSGLVAFEIILFNVFRWSIVQYRETHTRGELDKLVNLILLPSPFLLHNGL